MAEMVGFSRGLQGRNGVVGGLVAVLKLGLSRLSRGRRSRHLQLDEWPDYLLRDIGLDRTEFDRADPRSRPIDWLGR
jgi:uncharacterized protein YjiS (DUF1127 family)